MSKKMSKKQIEKHLAEEERFIKNEKLVKAAAKRIEALRAKWAKTPPRVKLPSYSEQLKKRYPRNTKLQNMLKKDMETFYARFSMDSVDPDDILAEGEYTFIREIWLSGGKNSKYKTVYESKTYTDPTYRDAWKEFKKGQKAMYDEIGTFDHVFLEDVFLAKGKKNKLTFGTGS